MAKISRRNVILFGIASAAVGSAGVFIHAVDEELAFEPAATLDKNNPDSNKIAQIFANAFSSVGSDSVGIFGFFKTSLAINKNDVDVLASEYTPSRTADVTIQQINPHTFDVRVMHKGSEAGIALRENGTVVGTIKAWKSSLTADEIINGTESVELPASRPVSMVRGNPVSRGPGRILQS